MLCMLFKKRVGLDIKIIRPSTLFGVNDFSGNRVLDIFLRSCLRNEPVTVFDANKVLRFTSVEDVYGAIKCQLRKNNTFKFQDGALNIVTPEKYSVLELAQLIKTKTGSTSEINCLASESGFVNKNGPELDLISLNSTVFLKDWLSSLT